MTPEPAIKCVKLKMTSKLICYRHPGLFPQEITDRRRKKIERRLMSSYAVVAALNKPLPRSVDVGLAFSH